MPLIETKGAASAQGFGGAGAGASGPVTYIEDVFSTWLVTPTLSNTNYSVTNGIDVSGKGGMVWMKARNAASTNNLVYDTARGASAGSNNALITNSTNAQQTAFFDYITGLSNGFTVNFVTGGGQLTNNGINYASWTFRKQPKFFDVVTYTGDGTGGKYVSHSLGSAPGCIIIKCTSTTSNWMVWHRSISGQDNLYLNATDGTSTVASDPISVPGFPSSLSTTQFEVSTGADSCNTNGATYVAYLFAHNAGGFGLSGSDNVISCGSYTGNGSATGPTVTLGYEPQWLLIKNATDGATNWTLVDNMRGFPVGNAAARLLPNLSDAEYTNITVASPLPTGFQITNTNSFCNTSGSTYIYIAIRRGPMKVPTSGTSVFSPVASSAASGTALTTNFPVDTQFGKYRSGSASWSVVDRLRGVSTTSTEMGVSLATNSTAAEGTASGGDSNNWGSIGFSMPSNLGGISDIFYNFRRAPGFFDEVCYTGTGSATTQAHNLGVVPEMIIAKNRSTTGPNWQVYHSAYGPTLTTQLNLDNAQNAGTTVWNSTTPTASVFSIGTSGGVNTNGNTYVAYLFATCAGVSKVGSYTGTGALQTINCGFTGGARFVLIKRTDSTGGWYVYDSARGISSGNDPYLFLNSTAAEVTGTNYVDTTSVGFQVTAAAPAGLNANGGTYIFLAIA